MTTSLTAPRRRAFFPALALLACACAQQSARADSVVYKCTDEQGRVLFTDTNRGNCKLLDMPGGTTIAAPPQAQTPRKAAPMRQGAAPAAAATPADFPRVDNAQQRARDSDRREILNDELRSEEKKLAELRRDFNGGEPERHGNERNYVKYQERVADMRDNIGRTEKNIEALRREIANIR